MNSEIEKIKERYKKREKIPKIVYSYFNIGHLFLIQERERKTLKLLSKYRINNLADKKIIDVGCGSGNWILEFVKWGANPQNICGVDLLEDMISKAKKISSNINFICANAENLPFQNEEFDIVLQSTCFTSIFDIEMKKKIAQEMLRVLKKDGIILWYDFRFNNPKNPDVKGIKRKEIKKLFPNCQYDFNLITLAPPLARKLAPISYFLCYLLGKILFLRTHYLVIIKKK